MTWTWLWDAGGKALYLYSLNHNIDMVSMLTSPKDISQLSQIRGNFCGSNGVSVPPYAHPQHFKVLKHLM